MTRVPLTPAGAAYTFLTHKPDNLSRHGASRAHHTPAPISREAQTPLTVQSTQLQHPHGSTEERQQSHATIQQTYLAPASGRRRQARRCRSGNDRTKRCRHTGDRRRDHRSRPGSRRGRETETPSAPTRSRGPRGSGRTASATLNDPTASVATPSRRGGPAATGRSASPGGPAAPGRSAAAGRSAAPGRPGRRRTSRPGPQHHRAQGQEHPAADADREGSHGRRRDRHAQAGADLPDPEGADRAERLHLLRGRPRGAAGWLRIPARAGLQLPAGAGRHLRLAVADSQVRSADRRHGLGSDPAAEGRGALFRAHQGRGGQLRSARAGARQAVLREPDAALSADALHARDDVRHCCRVA